MRVVHVRRDTRRAEHLVGPTEERSAKGEAGGGREQLRGLTYEEGARALRPDEAGRDGTKGAEAERAPGAAPTEGEGLPKVEEARIEVLTHLVTYAANYDPDVKHLVFSHQELLVRKTGGWRSFRHVIGYLHDHANGFVVRPKVHEREFDVLLKCKIIAALVAGVLHLVEPTLARMTLASAYGSLDPWKGQMETLFDATVGRFSKDTEAYYRASEYNRADWKRLPPFFRQ